MKTMNITNAKYYGHESIGFMIKAEIDGVMYDVPMNMENMHYAEIKKQVDSGELTIEPADKE